MNILAFEPPEPTTRLLMERALDPHVLIGMPHLTPHGLSETWLMKELGHRHWLMLARHLGLDNADFRTGDGRPAYAAICATSLTDAELGDVRADDILTIRSGLTPVSRTQVATRHRLFVRGSAIGTVELVSAFVQRTNGADNHAIARVALPSSPRPTAFAENVLARTASALRNGRLDTHLGLPATSKTTHRRLIVRPEPSQDFNGAGLFYFVHFQALAARTLAGWFAQRPAMVRRDVFFSGNIRPGEALRIELAASNGTTTLCRIRREDGTVIGRIFTVCGSEDGPHGPSEKFPG